MEKPFWEQTYSDQDVSTFSKGPTVDVKEFNYLIKPNSRILDVGCGEGRNSIYLAKRGHRVDAFDISHSGIDKAKQIAFHENATVNFFVCDLGEYIFSETFDVILSHGVLHLPEKHVRNQFIDRMQLNTRLNGYNFVGIFTNRLPATPDNAPFTKSLFDMGELPTKYDGWSLVHHLEGTFNDEHPGGIKHTHAYERVVAQKK